MYKETLSFYRMNSNVRNFVEDKYYLVLDINEQYHNLKTKEPCYNVVNEHGNVEVVCQELFGNASRYKAIKKVYSLIDRLDIKKNECYGVYKINNIDDEPYYMILDETYHFATYNSKYFIEEEEYNLLKDNKDELDKFIEIALETARARDTEKQRKKELELNEKKEKEEIEKKKKLFSLLMKKDPYIYNIITKKEYIKSNPKNILTIPISFIIISIPLYLVNGKILLSLVCSFISSLIPYLSVVILDNINKRKTSKENLKKESNISKDNIYLLKNLNDDLLLMLKKIEINILDLLDKETVSTEMCFLIGNAINSSLEVFKGIKEHNLIENANVFQEDLSQFFKNILEYTDTLVKNSNLEEKKIEKMIYDNISSMLEKNAKVYEYMNDTQKQMGEIFK